MITILSLNILLISIVILSILVIYSSKQGVLGLGLKRYCTTNSFSELIVLLVIFVSVFLVITDLLSIVINYFLLDNSLEFLNVIKIKLYL